MFSKFRSNSTISAHHQSQNGGGYESNPISQHFEIGKAFASAGPELIWKIHGAFRKSDGKVCMHANPLGILTQGESDLFYFCGEISGHKIIETFFSFSHLKETEKQKPSVYFVMKLFTFYSTFERCYQNIANKKQNFVPNH